MKPQQVLFFAAPVVVAGVVPALITHWRVGGDGSATLIVIGGLLIAAGAVVLIDCYVRFVRKGGAPAPIALAERLVVEGAYRYVRNPIYLAVLAAILGQALVFANAALIAYFVTIALTLHFFVVGYEEPVLARSFPDDYAAYRSSVRRWLPRLSPWRGEAD